MYKEILQSLPRSYDDFVRSTNAWMEKDEDIRNAILKHLEENPNSTPSDVLKVLMACLGIDINKPLELVDDELYTGMRAG